MYDNDSTMYDNTPTFYAPPAYGTGLYDNNSGNGGGFYQPQEVWGSTGYISQDNGRWY